MAKKDIVLHIQSGLLFVLQYLDTQKLTTPRCRPMNHWASYLSQSPLDLRWRTARRLSSVMRSMSAPDVQIEDRHSRPQEFEECVAAMTLAMVMTMMTTNFVVDDDGYGEDADVDGIILMMVPVTVMMTMMMTAVSLETW